MRWPWCSRLAYEVVCGERDRLVASVASLEATVSRLTDSIVRIKRKERGMSETPAQAKAALPPMPNEVRVYLDAITDRRIMRETEKQIYRELVRPGGSWDKIVAKLYAPKEEEA